MTQGKVYLDSLRDKMVQMQHSSKTLEDIVQMKKRFSLQELNEFFASFLAQYSQPVIDPSKNPLIFNVSPQK